MRTFLLFSGLFLILSLPARTQTTGVVGINDYTVYGSTSGSVSCTPVSIPEFTTFTIDVSAGANLPVVIFVSPCPCLPGNILLPPTSCTIPFTAGFGFTNQSFDLLTTGACAPFAFIARTNGSGDMSIPILGGLPAMSFSTQAVVLDPSCATWFVPGVVTQAYDVTVF